ncbi:MAG: site-2 protease family protein [Candidatus Eisenbacteria bacterium]
MSLSPEEQRRQDNLRAVMQGMMQPPAPPQAAAPPPPARASAGGKRGWIGSIGAGLLLLLGKFKFLSMLLGVLKMKTLLTMFLSIAVYATQWGWEFAAGFVVLIFIHECGHSLVLHHEGIPASAPLFIPFVGAFIAMRGRPRDAYIEAKVGIGGPLLGSLAAWAVLAAGVVFERPLWIAIGHSGVFLNLFNLIPVSPLDGGRIAGVFSKPFWIVGYALGIVATVVTRSPILILVMLVGLVTLFQRLKNPVPGYDHVPRAQRLGMGLAYLALVIGLTATLQIGELPHPSTLDEHGRPSAAVPGPAGDSSPR